jgi:hypothetical protein
MAGDFSFATKPLQLGRAGNLCAPLKLCLALAGGVLALAAAAPKEDAQSPSAQPGQRAAADTVVGIVEDAWGPVAGARVRWKGAAAMVTTDRHGVFQLPPSETQPRRITAAAPGYFIEGVEASDVAPAMRLTPIPTVDCAQYQWIDPSPYADSEMACGKCHHEIHRQWQTGGHSRSAINRRMINLFDGTDWRGRPGRGWSLLDEQPLGGGVCTSCHAPSIPPDSQQFDDLRSVQGVAARGVHCDYCHKIAAAPTDRIGFAHGVFGVQLLRPSGDEQLFFGPLDDDDRGHSVYSPLQKDSRLCAACHEGILFGVPVYTTYSEWLVGSDRQAGRTCQSCHMAPDGQLANIAPAYGGLRRDPGTLATHGAPVGRDRRLRECLQLQATLQESATDLAIRVELLPRLAGHRLPTGYIDRQLILVVEGLDAQRKELSAAAGPRLPSPAGAELAGKAGRLYAKLLTDLEGNRPAPFWRAGVRLTDTRLYSNRPDCSTYQFPPETETVRVRLLYRRFWRQVARQKQWPSDEIVVYDRLYRRT